jgi:hypothetical protein
MAILILARFRGLGAAPRVPAKTITNYLHKLLETESIFAVDISAMQPCGRIKNKQHAAEPVID